MRRPRCCSCVASVVFLCLLSARSCISIVPANRLPDVVDALLKLQVRDMPPFPESACERPNHAGAQSAELSASGARGGKNPVWCCALCRRALAFPDGPAQEAKPMSRKREGERRPEVRAAAAEPRESLVRRCAAQAEGGDGAPTAGGETASLAKLDDVRARVRASISRIALLSAPAVHGDAVRRRRAKECRDIRDRGAGARARKPHCAFSDRARAQLWRMYVCAGHGCDAARACSRYSSARR